MKFPALPLALLASSLFPLFAASAQVDAGSYHVVQTFHPGGLGGWDYLTVDAESHRLFVPRGTHTQVLDEATGAVIADIPGQKRNHGVAIVARAGRGFISDGADGSVVIFDLATYRVLGKIKVAPDADGVIYDPASDKVLVVCGDAGVMVPISPGVDPQHGCADPQIDLGGNPESFTVDGRGKAYIDLVNKGAVDVVDTKTMKVIAKWPTAPGITPVGLAIDSERGRLFVGCRKPQKLIVMSTADGKILADLPIGAGVDAGGFAGDAFASCRDGTLAVVRESATGRFEVVQTVATAPGARTLGVDSSTRTVYLPTADLVQVAGAKRPVPKPGTFRIIVVSARE